MKFTAALKKLWPTLISVGIGAAAFLNPSVQAYAATHPNSAVLLTTGWSILNHWLQSPKTTPASKF
jgi:hypothetical protein